MDLKVEDNPITDQDAKSRSSQQSNSKKDSEEIVEYLMRDYYGGNPDKPRITNLEHLVKKIEKW